MLSWPSSMLAEAAPTSHTSNLRCRKQRLPANTKYLPASAADLERCFGTLTYRPYARGEKRGDRSTHHYLTVLPGANIHQLWGWCHETTVRGTKLDDTGIYRLVAVCLSMRVVCSGPYRQQKITQVEVSPSLSVIECLPCQLQ